MMAPPFVRRRLIRTNVLDSFRDFMGTTVKTDRSIGIRHLTYGRDLGHRPIAEGAQESVAELWQ